MREPVAAGLKLEAQEAELMRRLAAGATTIGIYGLP
jgi:hypothetical protein